MKLSKIEISAIQLAVNLYKKGHGLTHAARMANDKVSDIARIAEQSVSLVSNGQLSRKVKQDNLTHYYSKAYSPEVILTIQKKYQFGKSVSELASDYGVSRTTINNYLKVVF